MKPTIRDVARLAKVSITTVSRVMNNPELVAPDKRESVLTAIEKLKYQPNALARGLIHKRTQTLGVLIPDISNVFMAELIRGMEDAARENLFNLIICNTDIDKERMISYLQVLNEKQVDGIVFVSEPVYPDYYEVFKRYDIPLVLAATHSLEYEIPSVMINNEQAGYDAVEYLIRQGHEKIGIISGSSIEPISSIPRTQGFMRGLRSYGLKADFEKCVEYGGYLFQDGYEAMSRLIKKFPDLTAVFAVADEMALGAISYLQENGIRVPDEISVMGFDNTRLATMTWPKLTTVAQPIYEMGYRALNKLIDLIEYGTVDELRTYLPHEIIERESVRRRV
ncbi:LacI family DNA-binding transcriptional regulator [Effusibacillus consociatus]|uniref:LacI family DNA-binding transcriptional regulator n=1 Tax=Effusibacillus consociatus TaxID=1117041 RepID=A0ABV9Q3E3_9BACL